MDKTKFKAYFAWVIICIVWGTTYLAIRIGVETLPPMLFAGIRWVIAGSIIIPVLLYKGYALPAKRDFKVIAVVGILLLGIANGLVVVGEQWLPSGIAALIITTIPFWVVGFESVFAKGIKINKKIVLGTILGFAGVMALFSGELRIIEDADYLLGTLCLLAAVVAWASGSVYSKYKKIRTNPLMSAGFQMLIAGTAQIISGTALGEFSEFAPSQGGLLALIYLIIFGSLIGYVSFVYAISHLPVSFVVTYSYINPLIAVVLGWLVLDESLSWIIAVSTLMILIGVTFLQRGTRDNA